MRLDVSWIRKSNALSLFRERLNPRLVEHKQKLTRSSCAVFIPVCHKEGKLSLLYTKRTDTLTSHTGQISFPGGRCEEGETVEETSIREMWEEIGISPTQVWGSLQRPIVSLKLENVYGCVGYIGVVENVKLTLCPDEVSHIFTVPIEDLAQSRFEKVYNRPHSKESWEMASRRIEHEDPTQKERFEVMKQVSKFGEYNMPVFPSPLENDPIWGLTALMTDRLLYAAFKRDGYKKHDFFAHKS